MKLLKNIFVILTAAAFCFAVTDVSAKDTKDKVKDTIDQMADSLKSDIERLGDNLVAIQQHLEHYDWKGMIQGKATSGPVTLSNLKLNGHDRVIVVHPGALLDGQVCCQLNREVRSLDTYRVVLGFKGHEGQKVIGDKLGLAQGDMMEEFHLRAPLEPGVYELRFRTVNKIFDYGALKAWRDDHGHEPDASTTIGVVVVKK